jgi:hypothetical protein
MNYAKYSYNIIRQEGNLSGFSVEFTELSLTDRFVSIQVRDRNNTLIFEKTTPTGGIVINSDEKGFEITFEPEDTKGYAGAHQYEIDIMDNMDRPFLTIGGLFIIEPEINDR